jgi:hypothetical protein
MAAIVAFLVIHIALAMIVPKTIGAMITGGPAVDQDEQQPGAGTVSRAPSG